MSAIRVGLTAAVLAALLVSGCSAFVSSQHRIEAAQRDLKAGEWRRATIELNKVVQSDPKNVQAWLLLAKVALDTVDESDAQAALSKAVEAGAKGPAVDKLRVRLWLQTGKPQAILDAIAHGTIHLAEPQRSVAVARADMALGHANKAIQALEPQLKPGRDLAQARVVLADALVSTGRFGAAMQQLDTAEREDPKSPQPAFLRGRILMSRGLNGAAERALEAALKRMPPGQPIPDRVNALIALTEARLALGDVQAASQSEAELAKIVPRSQVAMLLAARIKLARHDTRGALNALGVLVLSAPKFIQARMLLGRLQLSRGKLQLAIQQAEGVLQQSPDDAAARDLLATAELKLGEPKDALRDLAPVLGTRAANPQLLALVGRAASGVGGAETVLDVLETNAWADSHNPAVRLQLAQGYLLAKRPQDALWILKKVPEDKAFVRDRLLITALLRARGPRAAQEQVERLLARHPHDPAMDSLAAAYFVSRGDTARARSQLTHALAAAPGNAALAIELARVEMAAGDSAAARQTLERVLAAHPELFPVRLVLADVLLRSKALGEARSVLEAGASSKAGSSLEFALARVDLARGKFKEANADLDKAIGPQPTSMAPSEEAVMLLLGAHQYKAALGRVDALLASDPHDPEVLALKGAVEMVLKDAPAAAAAYAAAQKQRPSAAVAVGLFRALLASNRPQPQKPLEQWLASEPHDWRVREMLGQYYIKIHALRPAAQQYEAVLRQAPKNVVALNDLAWLYGQLGDSRAESLAERAYRLSPQSAEVNDTLGWVLARKGDVSRSLPLLEHALKLDPSSPDIEYHYAFALAKSGKRLEARKLLQELLSTTKAFGARADAQRLLAATGAAP